MEKVKVCDGSYLVTIPEAKLSILCGCPENAVKFLIKEGLIRETEKEGVRFETGPKAILLSESPVQGGAFSNLAEFPVLQMLYKQGMILPKHPNNDGRKPMLIGLKEIVEAQAEYIYHGNYGITDEKVLKELGLSEAEILDFIRLKLRFAFGKFLATSELLDLRCIERDATALGDGVFAHRTAFNVYEFIYSGESVTVDMNLGPGERYSAPYALPKASIAPSRFSIIHIGEGDGWDPKRPCMASLISHKGSLFLIDAGPNMRQSLEALGLSVSDIAGVFFTHAHDDHFVGITSLLRSDKRIACYATPLVRRSIVCKLHALASITEVDFKRLFDVRDLKEGEWNDVGGLEAMPVSSPHPVETTVFFFRAKDEEGYRSYAHLADIAGLSILEGMITPNPDSPGISREAFERVKRSYLVPADIKKIDIGGGLIHGHAKDFSADTSGRLYLAHTALQLTEEELQVGSCAEFGEANVLIGEGEKGAAHEGLGGKLDHLIGVFDFLEKTALFGECISPPVLENIVAHVESLAIKAGQPIGGTDDEALYIVLSGELRLSSAERKLAMLGPGDFFGEEMLLLGSIVLFAAQATRDSVLYRIPSVFVTNIPVVYIKLKEELNKRIIEAKASFRVRWRAEYAVNIGEIDEQHEKLFELIGLVQDCVGIKDAEKTMLARANDLFDYSLFHFGAEEGLMARHSYPGLACQREEHAYIKERVTEFKKQIEETGMNRDECEYFVEFCKTWLLRHTLVEDRKYMAFFFNKGVY